MYTSTQLGWQLGIDANTVTKWARRGIIPGKKTARGWQFGEDAIEAGKAHQARPPASTKAKSKPVHIVISKQNGKGVVHKPQPRQRLNPAYQTPVETGMQWWRDQVSDQKAALNAAMKARGV